MKVKIQLYPTRLFFTVQRHFTFNEASEKIQTLSSDIFLEETFNFLIISRLTIKFQTINRNPFMSYTSMRVYRRCRAKITVFLMQVWYCNSIFHSGSLRVARANARAPLQKVILFYASPAETPSNLNSLWALYASGLDTLKKILFLNPPKHELLNHLLMKSLNQPYYLVDSTKQCDFD